MAENSGIQKEDDTLWKRVPGWNMYRVGDNGIVQSCYSRGGPRKPDGKWRTLIGDISSGYHRVTFYSGDRQERVLVHRLVLEVFVGPCPDGMEACHANGDRQDNRLENLRWDTPGSNWCDRKKHGNTAATQGSDNGTAKLNEDEVSDILSRLSKGETGSSLAREYGASPSTISMIKQRKTWRHIDG